jgi:predicted negative regulator of RcsB-dependent stress response
VAAYIKRQEGSETKKTLLGLAIAIGVVVAWAYWRSH